MMETRIPANPRLNSRQATVTSVYMPLLDGRVDEWEGYQRAENTCGWASCIDRETQQRCHRRGVGYTAF